MIKLPRKVYRLHDYHRDDLEEDMKMYPVGITSSDDKQEKTIQSIHHSFQILRTLVQLVKQEGHTVDKSLNMKQRS